MLFSSDSKQLPKIATVKPVCNDHLYDKIHHLRFIQECVLMKTEGTNLLLLTMSALWSSSKWPLATGLDELQKADKYPIRLGGRYRQVSLYFVVRVKS